MGIFIPAITLVLAWVFALVNWTAPGSVPDDSSWDAIMRWLLFLPGGCMFLVSGIMHTVFAKSTAKSIGWQTNGFQYEIGFVSLGLGVGGILAGMAVPGAWLPIAAAQSIFLVLAGVNHVREIIRAKNYAPGNTIILLYDFGLPISYIVALVAIGSL